MADEKKKRKPSAYNMFVKEFMRSNPGVQIGEAVAAYQAKGGGMAKSSSSKSCASTIVPTQDGSGVTTRNGQYLRASFEGHTKVEFDQGALGAVWSGIITGMRQQGGANLAALFPDLYPDAALAMRMNRTHADEFAIGLQMGKLLGATLVAYRVTPEEWVSWYAAAAGEKFIVPAQRGTCVTVTAALTQQTAQLGGLGNLPAAAQLQAQQMGGVLGAPGGAVLPGGGFLSERR